MRFAVMLPLAMLGASILEARSDQRPVSKLICPRHERPVCAGDGKDYVTTLRNECVFAKFSIEEDLVDRILYRGPCKGHEAKWSGWERDQDDIPANYEEYKKKNLDSEH